VNSYPGQYPNFSDNKENPNGETKLMKAKTKSQKEAARELIDYDEIEAQE